MTYLERIFAKLKSKSSETTTESISSKLTTTPVSAKPSGSDPNIIMMQWYGYERWYEQAIDACPEDVDSDTIPKFIQIDSDTDPRDRGWIFLDLNLMRSWELSLLFAQQNQIRTEDRKKLLLFIFGENWPKTVDELLEKKFSSLHELGLAWTSFKKFQPSVLNAEIRIGDYWVPTSVDVKVDHGWLGLTCYVTANVKFSEFGNDLDIFRRIVESELLSETKTMTKLSLIELLDKIEVRPIHPSRNQEVTAHHAEVQALASKSGEYMICTGDAILPPDNWFDPPFTVFRLGTKTLPKRVLIEPLLEAQARNERANGSAKVFMPLVRVFSIDLKRYFYVHPQDLSPYQYDKQAMSKLVLPEGTADLVHRLFLADSSNMFGDMLTFKHGGMITCAAGPTGVGKTMTAEAYAEQAGRPLYPIELGELGVSPSEIEKNLQKIFTRSRKWNCVLLLDEADVLFRKRDDDLERAAIVGVFLRMLDYYSGFLFLTTNLIETFDPAFMSRITLTIHYPPLSEQTRETIWANMLSAAGVNTPVSLSTLSRYRLNGRRIRSLVRILRMLYGATPTSEQFLDLLASLLLSGEEPESTALPGPEFVSPVKVMIVTEAEEPGIPGYDPGYDGTIVSSHETNV